MVRVFFFLFVLTVLELQVASCEEVWPPFDELFVELDVLDVLESLLFTTLVPFGRLAVTFWTLFGLAASTFRLIVLSIWMFWLMLFRKEMPFGLRFALLLDAALLLFD